MTNTRRFFSKVFVLNLPYKVDRRLRLMEHLRNMDLFEPDTVEWVRAISGDWCKPPAYFGAGAGAWGCLQTHIRIVQDAIMDGLESFLVLEDDVIFHPRAAELLSRFLSEIPDDWDQLYLGGQHLETPSEIEPNSPIWRARNVNRTHAFAIHKKAAVRFLQHISHAPDYISNGSWHVDHQLGSAHFRGDWNVYCPSWWIAGQYADQSNISGAKTKEMWWQPNNYAQLLPFIFVDPEKAEQFAPHLDRYAHFGYNLFDRTYTDMGLEEVASGYKGLGQWLEMIACEAIDRYVLPAICHREITVESVQKQWSSVIVMNETTDLAQLSDYPFNGLMKNPLVEMHG